MQGTGEQISWWLPRALNFKMVGSYAQTELGHGSNVRGLQTTAEYDKATQVRSGCHCQMYFVSLCKYDYFQYRGFYYASVIKPWVRL